MWAMVNKIKVVLLGLTGSGKTTVGEALKNQYGLPVLEVDDEVLKKNKGKWPKNEKTVDKLFAEVNKEVLKMNNVVYITSFLERQDISSFKKAGFNIIEMHADVDELLKRKTKRDSPPNKNLERFRKNYRYYLTVTQLPEIKRLFTLSLDTTNLSKKDMIRKVAKAIKA